MARVEIVVTDYTHFEDFGRVFDETMTGHVIAVAEKVTGDAIAKSPNDRGFFRNSIANEIEKPKPLTIIGHVFASAPHAAIIEGVDEQGNETEYGRRPGAKFPNIGELRGWVERVIGIAAVTAHWVERNPDRKLPSSETLLEQATFNVGRKIVARGIKPVRPLGRALRENEAFIIRELGRGVDEVLAQI